jgi:hypothetical protein
LDEYFLFFGGEYMIETFITIFIVYIVYYFVSVKRYDKTGHLKKTKKNNKIDDYQGLPSEVKYFVKKYNVDLEKVNLRGVLKLIGLVLGIDIAILSIIVLLIFRNSVVIQIVVASLFIIPIYLISLKFVGKYFKKKGLVKDV